MLRGILSHIIHQKWLNWVIYDPLSRAGLNSAAHQRITFSRLKKYAGYVIVTIGRGAMLGDPRSSFL